jgi:hypothetical protein
MFDLLDTRIAASPVAVTMHEQDVAWNNSDCADNAVLQPSRPRDRCPRTIRPDANQIHRSKMLS